MESIQNDKLEHLLALVFAMGGDDEVAFYDSLDTDAVKLSSSFYRKQNRIVRRERRRPLLRTLRTIGTRAAVFVLAVIVAGTVTVAAVPSLRRSFLRAVVRWTEEYISVVYPPGADSAPPEAILEIRCPTNLPEGTIEDLFENQIGVSIDYYSADEEYLFSFEQHTLGDRAIRIDSDDSSIVTYTAVNEYSATMITNTSASGTNAIIWSDGEYIYQISSDSMSAERLMSIAESVPTPKK